MTWPRGTREAGLALVTALMVWTGLGVIPWPVLRALETASLDLRFRVRGPLPPGPETTIVLVDDRSIEALGRWPLSRRLYANALGMLDKAGAKLVVFDLLFAEPDQPISPDLRNAAQQAISGLPEGREPALRSALSRLAGDDPDGDFEAAIRRVGRVLLPIAFDFSGPPGEEPAYLSDDAYIKLDNSPVPPVFPLQPLSALLPVERLATAAAGLGHVNIAYDLDGAPRYDYVTLPYSGDFLPSMPIRAVSAFLGIPWPQVGLALGADVHIGPITVPTDPAMRLVVNYRGPRGTFRTFSFLDLLNGHVPQTALQGRIVLIGATFIGQRDTNPSPFGQTQVPGTERMASIIDMILHRDFIRENPPPWNVAIVALIALLAVLTGGAAAILPTRAAALAAALPVVAWFSGAQIAFDHGIWLPMVNPIVALLTASGVVLLFRYGVVDREGRVIKSAFRHYLAPEMVNVLAAHPERLKLGGETRPMTLLFCDIRGFTSISEQFKANPQGLTRVINRFLTPMTDLIMARHGTIDKYMGDCIMAFWNAPLDDPRHADHACESALAMIRALDEVNAGLEAEAKAESRPFLALHVGVGLNSGDCVVGNMGSDQRFDYSVLGDAVNLASRLEGQSKTYHVPIVIGETTRQAAPGWAAIELDLIAVKGKAEAVRVYTLLGDAALAQTSAFQKLCERHDSMLAAYRHQEWDTARAALAECRPLEESLAGVYDLYDERIAFYEANSPGPGWDGTFIAMTK